MALCIRRPRVTATGQAATLSGSIKMTLSVGVLIIGSLYWDDEPDNPSRRKWREARLALDEHTNVSAPIRYGRISKSRGCSYSMVFSASLCEDHAHLGSAIAVPCKQGVSSIGDLVDEAEWLWAAERNTDSRNGKISACWGSVAVKVNPNRNIPSIILNGWAARVSKESSYGKLKHANDETGAVTAMGLLNIPWPSTLSGDPLDLDVILATATNPTIIGGRYPSAKEIAERWKSPSGSCYVNYFWYNRKHNITTFQDPDIERYLSND